MAALHIGVDGEEQAHMLESTSMPDAQQPDLRFARRIGILAAALGLSAMVLGSVAAGRPRLRGAMPVDAHALQWKVREANVFHKTELGMAPDDITVSGLCRECFNGNGKYIFTKGNSRWPSIYRNEHGIRIVYDKLTGRWQFEHDYRHMGPRWRAQISQNNFEKSKPGQAAGKPCPTPPASEIWEVHLVDIRKNVETDVVFQRIQIQVGAKAPIMIEGEWVYRFTALPHQTVKITHGKQATTNHGNTWDVHGSASVSFGTEASAEVSGKAGVPIFGPEAETKLDAKVTSEVTAEISAGYEKQWNRETQTSDSAEISFTLPSDKGHALWQWMLMAKGPSGEKGTVLTQQYAFTMGGTSLDKPKCYPGGSTDGYMYQKCHHGWYINGQQ